MTEDEENFLRRVDILCAKPGLYIGRGDFYALVMFLEGYIMCMAENGKMKKHPLGGLLPLLEETHGFSNPAWGWARHYLHDKKTDDRAILDFPAFLREALAVPDSRIDEISGRRGQFSHTPPPSPQTAKYDH